MQELNARFHNFLHLCKIMTHKGAVFGLSDSRAGGKKQKNNEIWRICVCYYLYNLP